MPNLNLSFRRLILGAGLSSVACVANSAAAQNSLIDSESSAYAAIFSDNRGPVPIKVYVPQSGSVLVSAINAQLPLAEPEARGTASSRVAPNPPPRPYFLLALAKIPGIKLDDLEATWEEPLAWQPLAKVATAVMDLPDVSSGSSVKVLAFPDRRRALLVRYRCESGKSLSMVQLVEHTISCAGDTCDAVPNAASQCRLSCACDGKAYRLSGQLFSPVSGSSIPGDQTPPEMADLCDVACGVSSTASTDLQIITCGGP